MAGKFKNGDLVTFSPHIKLYGNTYHEGEVIDTGLLGAPYYMVKFDDGNVALATEQEMRHYTKLGSMINGA